MEPQREGYYPPMNGYPVAMPPYPPPHLPHPFASAHMGPGGSYAGGFAGMATPLPEHISPGLHNLYQACRRLYPGQLNPLQVTAVIKYWLGGPDPLDYISMYANSGDPKQNIPPHWHYISFGLSDLYGDGRVHEPHGPETPSGFGFELSFRLKKEPNDTCPPTWPATVMQSLAKYVFQTENVLCPGDHVSWHCSLDNSDSRIQHMLMTDDPQLGTVPGPFGTVTFIQIVGVTVEELHSAQQWNGLGVIDLMKSVSSAGGPFLVTDMQRSQSIFELDKEVKEAVEDGINAEGSNLSGVSAKCFFKPKITHEQVPSEYDDDDDEEEDDEEDEEDVTEDEVSEDDQKEIRNQVKDDSNGVKGEDGHTEETTEGQNDLTVLNKGISSIKIADGNSTENSANKNGNEDCGLPQAPPSRAMMSPCKSEASSSMSVSHEPQNQNGACLSRMSYTSETGAMEPTDLLQPRFFKQIHISLNLEAGLLLPLALRGRLKHNHHFTYKSSNLAITLLTPSISGACVTIGRPYAIYGSWLQVLLTPEFVDEILTDLENMHEVFKPELLPKTLCWNHRNFAITFTPEDT